MNPYQSKPNAIHANEQQQSDQLQKWELPFRDLLDEIYYPGYAAMIIVEDPEEYHRQYWYFIKMYD
jgi:hypothetical protein